MAKQRKGAHKRSGLASPDRLARLSKDELGRLKRVKGSAGRFYDPVTRSTYSGRAVKEARFGMTLERHSFERKLQRFGGVGADEDVEGLLLRYRQAEKARRNRKTLLKRSEATGDDSPFWDAVADLRSGDMSAGGKKAQALVLLGLRDPDATYRVGESPKLERTESRRRVRRNERKRYLRQQMQKIFKPKR